MKLLNKTSRSYLIYAFSTLLITIPLFYFAVRNVLLHAVDRSLRVQMGEIRANLPNIHSQNDLETWSRLDKDIMLSKADSNFSDKISTVYRFTERHHHREQEPFRQISGTINVDNQ